MKIKPTNDGKNKLFLKLCALREKRGITTRRLASDAGFHQSLWVLYEKGTRNPTWENLFAAAKALELKVEIDVS